MRILPQPFGQMRSYASGDQFKGHPSSKRPNQGSNPTTKQITTVPRTSLGIHGRPPQLSRDQQSQHLNFLTLGKEDIQMELRGTWKKANNLWALRMRRWKRAPTKGKPSCHPLDPPTKNNTPPSWSRGQLWIHADLPPGDSSHESREGRLPSWSLNFKLWTERLRAQ